MASGTRSVSTGWRAWIRLPSMDDQGPSEPERPDDQAVFLEARGPAVAAAAWARHVLDDSDLGAAWPLMTRPLRLALVQSWLLTAYTGPMRDRDTLAAAIADRTHPLWSKFAAWRMARWHAETFAFLLPDWGVASIPEAATLDVEFVRLAAGTAPRPVEPGQGFVVQTLTMRLVDDRWLVAGIGRGLAVPGWPPSESDLPTIHT